MTDEPVVTSMESPAPEHTPDSAASTAAVPAPPAAADAVPSGTPMLPAAKATGRYTLRFALIYTLLGIVLLGTVVGMVVIVLKPGHHSSGPWSSWKPTSGSTASVTSSIATHVAQEYKLNKAGAPLVAVVSGSPEVTTGTHKVAISHIAVRKAPQTNTGVQIYQSGSAWSYQLCGLGTGCSIASGQPSQTRGRLVRREALEAALYTFKYAPAIDSVIAFMPPPPGQTASTLLFLQRSSYQKELSQPLRKTLPLATPPLPTVADSREAATIDRLTLPTVYSYSLQALQDNSALLVLDPVSQ